MRGTGRFVPSVGDDDLPVGPSPSSWSGTETIPPSFEAKDKVRREQWGEGGGGEESREGKKEGERERGGKGGREGRKNGGDLKCTRNIRRGVEWIRELLIGRYSLLLCVLFLIAVDGSTLSPLLPARVRTHFDLLATHTSGRIRFRNTFVRVSSVKSFG